MKYKKNKRDLLIVSAVLFIILVGLVVMFYPDPYTERTTLEKQYLGNATGNGGECTNCLIMEVGEVYINKPGVAYPVKKHAIYYFAGEHELRSDLHQGDSINIKWEYVWFKGYRIRDVSFCDA